MAEFMNQDAPDVPDFFNAIGRRIPPAAREKGVEECKKMGLPTPAAVACVGPVVEQLQRDKMFEAQGEAMKYLDFTGAIRLIAVLLANTPR